MSNQNINLAQVFQQVTQALGQNQQSLNQMDEINQDHGDHMVDTFQTITNALQKKQGDSPAKALSYASKMLKKNANNGSAKLYAQGLEQASQKAVGQNLDPQMAIQLLQTLIGGGQAAAQPQQPAQPQAGGLLGSLISGLTGGGAQNQQGGLSDGLDFGDLVTAGQAFMQSKQQGQNNLEALMFAITAASGMGNQPHRQKSTQLVANTFLQSIQNLGK